jgi:hypothetical protein
MQCSWCDRSAQYFMLSDRQGPHVDRACREHMLQWQSLYRRAVPLPSDAPTSAGSRGTSTADPVDTLLAAG